ncbi:phytanoyl-CoA dioxygenase family protein [Nonomuraea sp. NPDC049141]|uniref:phytanoyl-CoA dioxygenase family protein n=1 Tax=Nonomuraea sp. NPDC049141 TaxID=3155500 RepID=UPI0033CFF8C4
MALSPSDLARYRSLGYLTDLPGLTAGECAELGARIAAFGRRHGVQEQLVLRNKAHLKLPALAPVVADPRIVDAVEAVLGPDVLCWGSSLFIKEPGRPEQVAWHQDSYYWDIEGDAVCTAWVALIPSTSLNGAMRVIPGSHLLPPRRHAASPSGSANMLFSYEEISGEVDEAQAVELTLSAGRFSLHHMAIVHGSAANHSAGRRMGYSITYLNPAKVRHHARRTHGLLVRGREWGMFSPDPVPDGEMDPAVLAFVDEQFGRLAPRSGTAGRTSSR